MKVAALFVQKGGIYYGLPDVDPWDQERDARLYPGPHPVVAHPPCATWGTFARTGKTLRPLGDDDGCFAAALEALRKWGGVLEHPWQSSAWKRFGLIPPRMYEGWSFAGDGGWTCGVDQGRYGHRTKKPTWLYAFGCDLPPMRWAPQPGPSLFNTLSTKQRAATPIEFRDLLLGIARSPLRRAA
jgi:hypothetical protein